MAADGPRERIRRCLRCNKRFPSEGSHNRLCEYCLRKLDEDATPEWTWRPTVRLDHNAE